MFQQPTSLLGKVNLWILRRLGLRPTTLDKAMHYGKPTVGSYKKSRDKLVDKKADVKGK